MHEHNKLSVIKDENCFAAMTAVWQIVYSSDNIVLRWLFEAFPFQNVEITVEVAHNIAFMAA